MRFPLVSFALSLLFSTALGAYTLSTDFQSDTVGSGPAGATLTNATGRIMIVDNQSAAADPFGPAGNHSLVLQTPVKGAIPRVTYAIPNLTSGVLSLSAWSVMNGTDFNNPYFRIYFYGPNSGEIGIALGWKGNDLQIVSRNAGGTVTYTISDLWTSNTANDLSISFADQAFSLTLNGTLVETSDGISSFAFRDSITSLARMEFAIADTGNAGTRVFIDNFTLTTVIPEPSPVAMLLTGAAGIAFWTRRRLKKNRAR